MHSQEKSGWPEFINLTQKIHSTEELKKFFELFLTIEERELLASRFLIIKALLEQKLTQREIAAEYKVSIAQITRGSNAIKIIDPELKKKLIHLIKG
jgi:TrpR family transcriptional regulator, trp operon repressor